MVFIRRTSFKQLQLMTIALALLVIGIVPASARADSYDVAAAIPFPAPTVPAVIDPTLNGSTVSNALLAITGSCQLQNPATVVSIMRGSDILGSGPCSGSFNIQVSLQQGQNTLVVRTASASSQYGPDSQPVTVTLSLPPTTPSQPVDTSTGQPITNTPTTPAAVTATTNSGAAANLMATPVEPFSVLTPTTSGVSIQVAVGGGDSPYTITLNWGDGTTDIRTVQVAGTYTFTHSYTMVNAYIVHTVVRDVLGASTVFNYAVMSTHKTPTPVNSQANTPPPKRHGISLTATESQAAATIIGISLIAITTYRFGLRDEKKVLLQARSKTKAKSGLNGRRSAAAKPKPKRRKPLS